MLKLLVFVTSIVFSQSVDPIYITLNGDITNPDQEVSGLAWHNNDLVLLPQYPKGEIYSIPKQQIIEFLDSSRTTILPNVINWNTAELVKNICGFEGFESIIFINDTVYVTVEAERARRNRGYIAKGVYNSEQNEIKFNKISKAKIKTPVFLKNMTYETIVSNDESIITIYEVNSKRVNKTPIYYEFDNNLKSSNKKPFPFTEYRITDATELDMEGKFWVTNYFWSGDFKLLKLNENGIEQNDLEPVERLLEFQIADDGISRTDTPPINLTLSEFGESRNWEGIVRLNELGFLIVTDKFPGTILAFVPKPN